MKNLSLLTVGFPVALLAGCGSQPPKPPTPAEQSAALEQQYPDSAAVVVKDTVSPKDVDVTPMDQLVERNGTDQEATVDADDDTSSSPVEGVREPVPDGLARYIVTGKDQPTHNVSARHDASAHEGSMGIPVMQGSRYSLVSTQATRGQHDLLEQIINLQIPDSDRATVKDAMDYVLRGTGYGLCPPASRPQQILYGLPLPAAHYQLGPMPLREAMQILAGPAFVLQADPIARNFCYVVRDQTYVDRHDDIAHPNQNVIITPPATDLTSSADGGNSGHQSDKPTDQKSSQDESWLMPGSAHTTPLEDAQ
ncbi:PFGI-1 class ICE element type IV pilus protein PilL2 [Carnimonas bestiolae]|uniref:PFGI-1 class ICE element type IV pilus protein PilL2 n=1 Tax=Carnimonas bestiolae TaxID=3402172 RepID=UPI003EDCA76E